MPYFRYITLLVFIFISVNAYSEKVVMAFGQSLAPYIIEKNNSGVELSIIKEALAIEGHELVPIYTHLGNVAFMFDQGKVDAAQRYITSEKRTKEIFYGDVTVKYHDVLFSLDKQNIVIKSPVDLKKYSLLSFQGANIHYPRWLTDNYKHTQTSAQINQVRLLQLGLVDIVLSDKNIFSYHSNLFRLSSHGELKNIRMHIFTPPYKYNPVFKSKNIAKAFNRGLSKLKKSGRYTDLISKELRLDVSITNKINLLTY